MIRSRPFALALLLAACAAPLTAAAQSSQAPPPPPVEPPVAVPPTDSARRAAVRDEVTRLRGFIRAAETQASKVLDALDSLAAAAPPIVPQPPVIVPQPPVVVPPVDTVVPPPADTVPPASPDPAASGRAALPELPRVYLDDQLVEASGRSARMAAGRTLTVPAGASLQAAVDSAVLGDEIVVEAGATFTGTLRLPAKTTGAGWITIRSSALAQLPAGVRVAKADSVHMPRLIARRPTETVIETETGAHHYRLAGLFVSTEPLAKRTLGYTLISLGIPSGLAATREQLPRDLVLERMLVLPADSIDLQRCVALNSAATAIVDSWIDECHGKGKDSQAIGGWSGTGPYKIVNNYLAGAGENVMFGGSDPRIKDRDSTGAIIGGTLPEDIEIRGNHFHKPAAWKGVWTIKVLLELKLGRRVLVEGNVFDGSWASGQSGFALNFKSTNQSAAPWSETSNVTVRYNVFRNVEAGMSLAGAPEKPAVRANRILVEHNLWEVGVGPHEGTNRLFQISNAPDVTVRRNTAIARGTGVVWGQSCCMERITVTENLLRAGNYGMSGQTVGRLDAAAPGWTFAGNVVATSQAARLLPSGNVYPGALAIPDEPLDPAILEALVAQLGSAHPGVGADLAALRAAIAGVVTLP